MKAWAHAAVRRWWRGEAGVAGAALDALGYPLERLYAAQVARRDRRTHDAPPVAPQGLRVVSVGNLVVGGTGKTPVAAWVARTLADAGAAVAILTRGYGGDEERLHRRWNPQVPVFVDPDRTAAATRARAQGCTVAVMDDGFQHRRLARDVDLVLLAAEDTHPGRMLPRGPFREPWKALERAGGVIVTRRAAPARAAQVLMERVRRDHPHLPVAGIRFGPGGWMDLRGDPEGAPEGATLTVTGVARPEAVAAQVGLATGTPTELMAYPDHHGFGLRDVKAMRSRARGRTVVVTEKDAVKLEGYASELGPVRVLAQELNWEEGEDVVTELVTATVSRDG